MSWLFGYNSTASQQQKQQEQQQESAQAAIDPRLGFDPNSIADVSQIISTPGGLDTSRLHPLAGLEKGVEYLDLEEESLNQLEGSQGLIPSRGWTDDLCYGTGGVYLLALGTGGAYGFFEGLGKLNASDPGKVKLNSVLNSITRRGPFLGNSAGVLALTYNLIDSTIDSIRGKHDDYNSIVSGALAGALFKSTKGFKPAGIASILTAGAAATWCGIKRLMA